MRRPTTAISPGSAAVGSTGIVGKFEQYVMALTRPEGIPCAHPRRYYTGSWMGVCDALADFDGRPGFVVHVGRFGSSRPDFCGDRGRLCFGCEWPRGRLHGGQADA